MASINVDIEVDIEDYLDEADEDCLIEEVVERAKKDRRFHERLLATLKDYGPGEPLMPPTFYLWVRTKEGTWAWNA